MRFVHADCLRTFERLDGKARLHILKRHDGLYEFRGEAECDEDGDTYWAPTEISGLYQFLEAVEQDAILSVPWLHAMMMNEDSN